MSTLGRHASSHAAASPQRRSRQRPRGWKHAIRHFLRLRTGLKVDGVYYKELTPTSLARALAPTGPGHKDYRVTFRDRSKMIIHATPARTFADLSGAARLDRYEPLRMRLQPGLRVLDACCGTGSTSAWLADLVGSFGAVVALDQDEESIQFARKRYEHANIAYEVGDVSSLRGETDDSFDGAVLLEDGPPPGRADFAEVAREIWRVVKPGGWLLLGPVQEGIDAETLLGLDQKEPGENGRTPCRVETLSGTDLLIVKPTDERR